MHVTPKKKLLGASLGIRLTILLLHVLHTPMYSMPTSPDYPDVGTEMAPEPAPTDFDAQPETHEMAPAPVPEGAADQPTPQQTEQIDPAAQPSQLTGEGIINAETTKPLLENKSPKIMELFTQAEQICNKLQEIAKNLERTRVSLNASYGTVTGNKKLDDFIESANNKKGILQQIPLK